MGDFSRVPSACSRPAASERKDRLQANASSDRVSFEGQIGTQFQKPEDEFLHVFCVVSYFICAVLAVIDSMFLFCLVFVFVGVELRLS